MAGAGDMVGEKEVGQIPGTASLVEELDKRLLVVLVDGRMLVGVLRSFDQFSNIVLEETVEKIVVGDQWGEAQCGVFIVRGENLAFLCQLDEKEPFLDPERFTQVDENTIKLARTQEEAERGAKADLVVGGDE